MKTLLYVILTLIVVATAVFIYSRLGNTNVNEVENAITIKTYKNDQYGYSVEYPENLDVKVYLPENVVFGRVEGDIVDGVAEARVIDIKGSEGEDFVKAASKELQNLCAADGPNESYSCTGVKGLQPFKTKSGLNGFVLYLDGEIVNLQSKVKTSRGKGPYFVFTTKSSATGSRVVVVHPPLNKFADETNAEVVRSIAQSLTLFESQDPNVPIANYISERLSDLSPKKEVLGGKFYITSLEAHGGLGTVKYEDGHNAYVADFSYNIDEMGVVSVSKFKIRE